MCSLITYCTVQVLAVDICYHIPRTNGILWVSLVYQSVHPISPVKPGSGSRPWRHLLAMLWVWKYSQLGLWPGRGEGSRTSEEIESSACGKTELYEIQHIHMQNHADIFVIVHSEYSHLWSSERCIFRLWDSLTWSRAANFLLIASLRQKMSVQLSVVLTFGRAGQSFFCWKGCVSRLCLRTQASAQLWTHICPWEHPSKAGLPTGAMKGNKRCRYLYVSTAMIRHDSASCFMIRHREHVDQLLIRRDYSFDRQLQRKHVTPYLRAEPSHPSWCAMFLGDHHHVVPMPLCGCLKGIGQCKFRSCRHLSLCRVWVYPANISRTMQNLKCSKRLT